MRRSLWRQRRPFRGAAGVVAALLAIAVLAVLATWLGPGATPLAGSAEVVDGDTLRLGATRVRLTGIDAPELEQSCTHAGGAAWPCGKQARAFLADLVGRQEVNCVGESRDRYGRTLATCRVGDTDLGRAVVEAGWAVAELDYAFAEVSARAAGRGIWAGRFETPADWRRDHGATEPGLWEWIRAWFQ